MNGGWIKLPRSIMDDPIYFAEPFTRVQAWIDLLLLANYADAYFYIRGNRIDVKRGQVGRSKESLAERWKWSRGKVQRFLDDMETDGRITQQKSRLTTLISISNFDELDLTMQQTKHQIGQQIEQQTDTNNRDKRNKNNNILSSNEDRAKPHSRFIPPTLEEVKAYALEKGFTMDCERFIDFYESKGWMVGKNKMKDWKAAVRNWAKGESTRPASSPRKTKSSESRNVNDEWQ